MSISLMAEERERFGDNGKMARKAEKASGKRAYGDECVTIGQPASDPSVRPCDAVVTKKYL
jgi:hypothetical protein